MTDRWLLVTAAAATLGAVMPWGPGLALGALLVLLPRGLRHPCRLVLAAGLLASGLAQRSLDGLDGLEERMVVGEVALLTDPRPSFGGLRVDVRVGGRRLEGRAHGLAADALSTRLAGDKVQVRGTAAPLEDPPPWLLARHVSGRLTIHAVEGERAGGPVARVANGLRRTLSEGAASLPPRQRALFTGLVIGDDRHQPADLADDFLGAGLTHLLAVSGQNVAFVLALSAPLLRALRLWPRLAATLGVIFLFGVVTRFEPSVLRASAMAGLAATVAMAGRPTARLRIVALAVTGLLLVDPLLVHSVGFRLSVAASIAIVVLAPRLAAALPGPAPLRESLGVTIAAQLGVAPVLLATFGPVPVASLPANLLAVPVAGLVMVWGLTAGMFAGLVGGGLAGAVHLPTRLGVGWLELVAHRAARARLGELGAVHVLVATVGLGMVLVATHRPAVRRTGWLLATGAVVVALTVANGPTPLRTVAAPGVVRWRHGPTEVVVLGGMGGGRALGVSAALEALRRAGVRSIDLLVVADPAVSAHLVDAVELAYPVGTVVAHREAVLDAGPTAVSRPPPGTSEVVLDRLVVRTVALADRLVVEAWPRSPPDGHRATAQ